MTLQSEPSSEGGRRNTLIIFVVVLLLIGLLGVGGVGAYFLVRDDLSSAEEPTIAYILDTSPRMSQESAGSSRLSVAQAIMAEVIRPADPEFTAGLRVFGSGAVSQSCDDTELVVPFAPSNQPAIADELLGLTIGASTDSALAQSMVAAIRDLNDAIGPHHMVVVTGGEDSCNAQAGELIANEAERAGIDLQTFVVGFQVSEEQALALKTMADRMGDGTFFNAPDADALLVALLDIQNRIESGAPSVVADQPVVEEDKPDAAEVIEDPTEASPEVVAGGYDSQTACDHPYFPLREGAHWDYSYDGTPATWDVTSVTGDLSAAPATVVIETEGITITYTWACGADGIFYYQAGVFDFSELGGSFAAELSSQSGSPLPPPEAFIPGASWTSAYTMTMNFEVEGTSFSIINEIEETHTAGELQEMTTTAGTFDVIPISTSGTTTTSSFGSTFTNTSNGTCAFAVGVGWLGCNTVAAGETSVSELVSYSVP
jgi:hypothetical protein